MLNFKLCLAAVTAAVCMVQTVNAEAALSGQGLRMTPPLPKELAPSARKVRPYTRVLAPGTVFHEDFESVTAEPPYSLPDGWSVSPTPGHPDDKWIAGTLYGEKGVIDGKYAIILPVSDQKTAHDSWMFSPAVELEGGKNYRFEFQLWMQSAYEFDESLHLYIGQQPTREAMTDEVFYGSKSLGGWAKVTRFFAPAKSGTYYLGFHADSPANTGGMMVDEITVMDGDRPFFEGAASMDFGDTDELASPLVEYYTIENSGMTDLEVSLKEASPEISIEGLPVSVGSYEQADLRVTLDVRRAGRYKGYFILSTNDPVAGDIRVDVKADVAKSVVSDYIYEDFEGGGPDGWILSKGTVNGANFGDGGGRAFYTTSYVCFLTDDNLVGFTTNYINMGDNPEFSFSYRLTATDLLGNDLKTATPAEEPQIRLFVSDDNGSTWKNVYTIAGSEGNPHVASTDYRRVSVNLSDYAGKLCRFMLKFGHDNDDFMAPLEKTFRICVDNVEAGTPLSADMALCHLRGTTLADRLQELSFIARVRNSGASNSGPFSVELYDTRSGHVIDKFESDGIERLVTLDCPLRFTPSEQGSYCLGARVIARNDLNNQNDESNILHVAINGGKTWTRQIIDNTQKLLAGPAYPVNFYAVNSETQTIYKATEIGMSEGEINSLAYYSINDGDYLSEQFQIYVGETDLDNFDEAQFVDPASLTKVFDGTVYIADGRQPFVIPFDKPYHFTGRNLVVYAVKHGREFISGKNYILCPGGESRSMTRHTDYALDDENPEIQVESVITYPVVDMHLDIAPSGTLAGNVAASGVGVKGARLTVEGTKYMTMTDADGKFSLTNVKAGEGKLLVEAIGYNDVLFPYTISEDETSSLTINLSAIPTHVVSGRVSDENGNPVGNVRLNLSGYDSFETITDVNGKFSISGVWSRPGVPYTLTAYNPYYITGRSSVEVNSSDIEIPVSLRTETHRPFGAKANWNGNAAIVSWKKPLPEMHHDSGTFAEAFGSNSGWSEVIFGSAYRKHASIHEISWYLNGGDHNTFNVIIFGLTDGVPDNKKVLYVAQDVDFKDDSWNTFSLPQPVEADGFMAAVSCNGFMGIGATAVTDEYPLERGMNYFAGDSFNYTIADQTDLGLNYHYMIRAVAEEYGESGTIEDAEYIGPNVSYNVYRINGNDMKLLGNTSETEFSDTGISSLADGIRNNIRYAVEAVYPSGNSRAVETNAIGQSGLESVRNESGIVINFDRSLHRARVFSADQVVSVRVFSADGRLMDAVENTATIDLSGLVSGIYIVEAIDRAAHRVTAKYIK